jgi:hypothetical protein
MRTYERSGVHVDQCTECRGIFLDRGELERLIDGENAWADRAAAPVPPPPPTQPGYAMPPSYDRGYDRDDDYRGRKPYKRRKSFLEELFD